MFQAFRKPAAPSPVLATAAVAASSEPDLRAAVKSISHQSATMGREAAEVRGQLDDAIKVSARQAQAVAALAQQLQNITAAQADIRGVATGSLGAVGRARDAVGAVG